MSSANHLTYFVLLRLHVSICNGSHIRIELLLSWTLRCITVVPQWTLEFHSPFVILSTSVMPSVICNWQSVYLRSEVRYLFFCYLIWSIFECSFKRSAYSDSLWSFLMDAYVCGLNGCSSLSEDMNGSWDGSFWLKLSLKKEMFLHNGNDTYWIISIDFSVNNSLYHPCFNWVKR